MTIGGRIHLVVFATLLSLAAIGISVTYAVFGIIGYSDLKSLTTSASIEAKTGVPSMLLLLSSMFMLAVAIIILLMLVMRVCCWLFPSVNFYEEVEDSVTESSDEAISIDSESSEV